MSNRFATASARIASRLKSRAGVSVTYRRSGTDYTLTVWRGNELENVETPGGNVVRLDSTERDYLFLASDLSIGVPATGDRIIDNGETFELLPVQGNPIWRWSDESRTIRRVHVKQVS